MFHFLGLIELFLQFRIGLLQGRQGDIELVGQGIDAVTEFADFIIEISLPSLGKIEMGHGDGQVLQFQQWLGHALGQENRADNGQDQPDEAADDDEPLDDVDILPHRRDGLADDDVSPVLDAVDEVVMLEIGHILIELDFPQNIFFRLFAIHQVPEFGNMYGQAEGRLVSRRFLFLPLDDDFLIFYILLYRQMDPPARTGRIDQLSLVDDEYVQGILLAQGVQGTFIGAAFFLVNIADFLARFDHGFLLHGIIVAVETEADGGHESDDEKNRKAADIEAGLKL